VAQAIGERKKLDQATPEKTEPGALFARSRALVRDADPHRPFEPG
jgi:hypothetical protein